MFKNFIKFYTLENENLLNKLERMYESELYNIKQNKKVIFITSEF